jgi:hypothetical protein
MTFPDTEPEIMALARLIVEGLKQAGAELPAPPVPVEDLQARVDQYEAANAGAVTATTALRQQHAVKDDALRSVVDGAKADLRYAEVVFRDQPKKLSQFGWGPRRSGSNLEAPGAVPDIRIVSEGDTWVILDWQPPVDGGEVAAYKIQRRKRDGGTWEDVASVVATQYMLSNQPRGVECEYRAIAQNKVGEGHPSATVTVVL